MRYCSLEPLGVFELDRGVPNGMIKRHFQCLRPCFVAATDRFVASFCVGFCVLCHDVMSVAFCSKCVDDARCSQPCTCFSGGMYGV